MSSRARVLIVDDDRDACHALASFLQDEGFDVIESLTAAGLAKHAGAIDVVILDLMLPYCDGFEALHLLHQKGLASSIPVLMISADSHWKQNRERARKLGVRAYLSKPLDVDELLQVLREVLLERAPAP